MPTKTTPVKGKHNKPAKKGNATTSGAKDKTKKKKKHKKEYKDEDKGITKPAIRRLARRGSVKRLSGVIHE